MVRLHISQLCRILIIAPIQKWKGRQRADVVVVELVKNFCGHCQAVTKQPLIEAIDVDGSSFITIEELDAFIKMAPKDWKYVQHFVFPCERSLSIFIGRGVG